MQFGLTANAYKKSMPIWLTTTNIIHSWEVMNQETSAIPMLILPKCGAALWERDKSDNRRNKGRDKETEGTDK